VLDIGAGSGLLSMFAAMAGGCHSELRASTQHCASSFDSASPQRSPGAHVTAVERDSRLAAAARRAVHANALDCSVSASAPNRESQWAYGQSLQRSSDQVADRSGRVRAPCCLIGMEVGGCTLRCSRWSLGRSTVLDSTRQYSTVLDSLDSLDSTVG
jgi:hypothetical protein